MDFGIRLEPLSLHVASTARLCLHRIVARNPADQDRSYGSYKHSPIPPELLDMPRQLQVSMIPSLIWLLKPGVKLTRMHIQHLAEQAYRPATTVVTDKGVPQSDSFAKYAAAFLICPVRQ